MTDEIANAGRFEGALSTLFVATAADHDVKLQQEVRVLSDARVASGGFAVSPLLREDVTSGLYLHPAVLRTFPPQVTVSSAERVSRARLLAALELGFYGPYIRNYVLLTFGEIGMMARPGSVAGSIPSSVDIASATRSPAVRRPR